jgi:histidine phosphotransferase ChpT
MDNLKFSALLCSRLCHDLANPVGAINNGVEMLEIETDPSLISQITDLIELSANQATNRLQYYRLAFGAAGGFGLEIGLDRTKAAMVAFFADHKVDVEFDPGQRTGSPAVVRLFMNLVLTAGETIIRGGKLTITIEDHKSGTRFAISAEAEKIVVGDSIPEALAGRLSADQLDPKSIPAALAAEIAGSLGTNIRIEDKSESRFSTGVDVPSVA